MAKPESIPQAVIKRLLPKSSAKAVDHWYKQRTADFFVVSFPKSGRTWLRVMLSTYFTRKYQLSAYETLGFENLHGKNASIPKVYFTHDDSYKARPNQLGRDKSAYTRRRLIYLVRDPRDVIVSLYFHRTKRDNDLDMSLIDFVLGEQGGLRTIIEFYNIWAHSLPAMNTALFLKYEEMRAHPVREFTRVLDFMGQAIDAGIIDEVVTETSFSRMKEKERAGDFDRGMLSAKSSGDEDSFKVRRGKVGGFADYFSEAEAKQIDEIVKQELSPIYGY